MSTGCTWTVGGRVEAGSDNRRWRIGLHEGVVFQPLDAVFKVRDLLPQLFELAVQGIFVADCSAGAAWMFRASMRRSSLPSTTLILEPTSAISDLSSVRTSPIAPRTNHVAPTAETKMAATTPIHSLKLLMSCISVRLRVTSAQ